MAFYVSGFAIFESFEVRPAADMRSWDQGRQGAKPPGGRRLTEVVEMKCKQFKIGLEHYADGEINAAELAQIEAHLDSCPVCRDRLSRIQAFRQELRTMARPRFSENALRRMRAAVSAELRPALAAPTFRLVEGPANWIRTWLMPTTVGAFASVVIGVSLVAILMLPANIPQLRLSRDVDPVSLDPLYLASIQDDSLPEVSPFQYARSRSNVSYESPSVNPAGTLVELTNEAGQDVTPDGDVTVVADVYRNGAARVTNVIASPKDRSAMARLMRALDGEKTSPPFVPASLDNRGDVVRVVLKFQSVDVNIEAATTFQ